MVFKNRQEAGQHLAQALGSYQHQPVVIFGLPRGGVVVALEVAKALKAPLDLILAHKIGHPHSPEYAIAAISERGQIVSNEREMRSIDAKWFEAAKKRQLDEIKRRRDRFLKRRQEVPVQGRIAILVDDGVATGLTLQAGILDLKQRAPQKIVVAVPVAPHSTAELLKDLAGEFVGLEVPEDAEFLGAVGAYYEDFSEVSDDDVEALLRSYG